MSLLELDRARVAPGSRKGRGGLGGVRSRQAVEAALSGLGYTAVIIKVTSHSKTLKATKAALEYLRHGCKEVENEFGQTRTIDQAKADTNEWKKPRHRGARTSTQIVISFKRGTDVRAAQETVCEFASEAFAGHQYFIAWHHEGHKDGGKDRHPHAHLVVCTPGDERALSLGPAELQAMRERLAELARERGIRMHARSYPHRHRSERHLPHDEDRAARRKGGPERARSRRAARLLRALRSKKTREILTKVRKERERRAVHEARALLKVARKTGKWLFVRLAAGRLRDFELMRERRVAPAQHFTEGNERDGPTVRDRLRILQEIYCNAEPATRQELATLRRELTRAYREEIER